MAILKPLPVEFFKGSPPQYNEPVRKWLNELDRPDVKKIGRSIMAVQFRWPIGMPLVKSLDTGL